VSQIVLNRLLARLRRSDSSGLNALTADLPPWLDGYHGQSTAQLIELAETHRMDSVALAFEAAIARKAERNGIEALTEPERVVLAVEAIEREVNNGGFDQLFFNSSKEHAVAFVSSLEAIGRPDVADLARQAIAALRLGKRPLTVEGIDPALHRDSDARDAVFEALDTEYYETAGDLAPALIAYIKANVTEVVLP
jgi:hypothetical protein